MEPDLENQQRCLTVPADDILGGCDSLQALRAALADAQLTADARVKVDVGKGVGEEGRAAEEAARWLRQCPSAPGATAQADELETTCAASMAAEDAVTTLGDFQGAARGANAVFVSALFLVHKSLLGTLRERRAAATSDEERVSLDADIQALTVPMENEGARAADAQRRAERVVSTAQAEAEEAQARAQADLDHLAAVRALHGDGGEELPAAAFKLVRERDGDPPPAAPRKGRGRRR